jgi:serine/threonine-protein kinase
MADGKSAPSVGELVAANYQILGTAGAGGMGVVYRALDIKLQRNVALKFLPAELNDSERDKQRFLREARTASSLDHPNVGVIYSIEETADQRSFIAMAYYEGKSLAQKIRSTGALSPAETADIAIQMLKGLEHAHAHGIEHRDIKPSNIMLTQDGMVKIVDFGLAHISQQTASKTHGISGTVAYMSPEQTLGRPVDTKSDIWAAGIVMVEMLTGHNPFSRDTIPATVFAIINDAPLLPDSVPQELQQVIYRALSKDPARRYQHCAEMLHDLEKLRPVLPQIAPMPKADSKADSRSFRRGKESSEFRRSREWASVSAWAPVKPRTNWKPRLLGAGVVVALLVTAFAIPPVRRSILAILAASLTGNTAASKQAAYEGYLAALGFMDRYDKPGNIDRAIESLQGSLKIDPLFALAYTQLGEAYRMKYQTDRNPKWLELALSNCQRAEELDNRIPGVYVTLAQIHNNQGKHDLAYQEFQQALDINPRDPAAVRGMAQADQSAGKLTEAEDGLKKAMALRPDDWSGPNELGRFYAENGKYQQAAAAYRQAVTLSPDNAFALSNLGSAYLSLGDKASLELAQQALEKSLSIQPSYEAYSNLGVLYLEQKRYAVSATMTRKALQIDDKDYLVWENLRTACEWVNDHTCLEESINKELPLLEKLVKVRAQDGLIHSTLAVLYAKRGENERAEQNIQSALAFAPDAPDALENIADAYESMGDHEKASLYLKKAMAKGATPEVIATDADIQDLLKTPTLALQK